jgi:flagellar basal-body rod modification protein FlgD
MATVPSTGAYTTPTNTSASTTTSKGTSELGKDEFLKLLVTQLQNQDPLSPMEDKEFISQMAQFSSLEQAMNLTKTMATMQATGMIGAEVYWTDPATGIEYGGIVQSVSIVNGEPKLQISDVAVDITTLTEHGNYTTATDLIGTEVSWKDDASGVTLSGTVKSAKTVDGKTYVIIAGPQVELKDVTHVQRPTTTTPETGSGTETET